MYIVQELAVCEACTVQELYIQCMAMNEVYLYLTV